MQAVFEADGDAGEIGHPHAVALRPDQRDRLFAPRGQAVVPQPAGARVVPAQGFDVLDLEAAGFHHLHGVADVIELGAREDVLQDHPPARADLAEVLDVALGAARDAVIEEDAALGKQLMHLLEIRGIVGDADVLVHADAGDFVVTALERHVIGERHRHAVLQPQASDLGLRMVVLRLGQGDAVRGHAVACAAWHSSAPQPLPMSSNDRPRSRSLRQIRSSLSRCACSSEFDQSRKYAQE